MPPTPQVSSRRLLRLPDAQFKIPIFHSSPSSRQSLQSIGHVYAYRQINIDHLERKICVASTAVPTSEQSTLFRSGTNVHPNAFDVDASPQIKTPKAVISRSDTANDAESDRDWKELLKTGARNQAIGQSLNIKEKSFTDEFCARLFATKTFSTDGVIKFLQLFGVESLDMLSLREMAARESSTERVMHRLYQLESAKIAIGTSSYAKLITELARNERQDDLTTVLKCDIHPANFGEETIRHFFPMVIKREEVTTSSENLTRLEADVQSESLDLDHAHTAVLDTAASQSASILHDEKGRLQSDSQINPDLLLQALQPFKQTSHSIPDRRQWAQLRCLTKALTEDVEITLQVPLMFWKEVFHVLGSNGRLRHLKRLIMRISHAYGSDIARAKNRQSDLLPHQSAAAKSSTEQEYHHSVRQSSRLKGLFSRPFARYLIQWGILFDAKTDEPQSLPSVFDSPDWTWGVQLIRQLERKIDLEVTTGFVAHVLTQQFEIARVRSEELGHKLNDVWELRGQAEKAWGGRLFYDIKKQRYHEQRQGPLRPRYNVTRTKSASGQDVVLTKEVVGAGSGVVVEVVHDYKVDGVNKADDGCKVENKRRSTRGKGSTRRFEDKPSGRRKSM